VVDSFLRFIWGGASLHFSGNKLKETGSPKLLFENFGFNSYPAGSMEGLAQGWLWRPVKYDPEADFKCREDI